MDYTIAAHPTRYKGVLFRSRLEARWAAFFDLAENCYAKGWKWEYEPVDLRLWTPDFRVAIPCGHSECRPDPGDPSRLTTHDLYVEIKPYYTVAEFSGYPAYQLIHGYGQDWYGNELGVDGVAVFGINPEVTEWSMAHGAGGGVDRVPYRCNNWREAWKEAGNIVQWKPKSKTPISIKDIAGLSCFPPPRRHF